MANSCNGKSSREVVEVEGQQWDPQRSTSVMNWSLVLPKGLLPTSNIWWMAARGPRPNLISEGAFAQHEPETDLGEQKVHNAAIILLVCRKELILWKRVLETGHVENGCCLGLPAQFLAVGGSRISSAGGFFQAVTLNSPQCRLATYQSFCARLCLSWSCTLLMLSQLFHILVVSNSWVNTSWTWLLLFSFSFKAVFWEHWNFILSQLFWLFLCQKWLWHVNLH